MNAVIAPRERELIQQLLDDVGMINDQFLAGMPKPQATRTIFVPILRRWIAEGLFYQAQKVILPAQVNFSIVSHAQQVKLCKADVLEHWMGLVLFGTVGISVGLLAEKHRGTGAPSIGDNTNPTPQKASVFFKQKILFWKGKFYTREDVIKMHANALGGVHLDFRKTQDEAHITEIKNYFGFEIKGSRSQMLIGDDISVGRADPARRQQVYDATELVTMDTARIFANGIQDEQAAFAATLA